MSSVSKKQKFANCEYIRKKNFLYYVEAQMDYVDIEYAGFTYYLFSFSIYINCRLNTYISNTTHILIYCSISQISQSGM